MLIAPSTHPSQRVLFLIDDGLRPPQPHAQPRMEPVQSLRVYCRDIGMTTYEK
jgi:hypothetical protein